jgi:hypothetical protein
MKECIIAALTASFVASTAIGDRFDSYSGDFDGRSGGLSQHDGEVFSAIYDEFTYWPPTWVGVFGNFLMNPHTGGSQLTLFYEIRTGISEGNGGTVIVPMTEVPLTSQTLTGRSAYDRMEWRIEAEVEPLWVWVPGPFFLSIMLGANAAANTGVYGYLSTTSGENGYGGFLINGNSYWNSSTLDLNFTESQNVLGPGLWDFSMGIDGDIMPAPGALGLFGLACLSARRRRRP